MKAGSIKKPLFMPFISLITAWNLQPGLHFHTQYFIESPVLDPLSFLVGHILRPTPDIFLKNAELLCGIGRILLTRETEQNRKRFICLVHKVPEATTTDETSIVLFKKATKHEFLLPTVIQTSPSRDSISKL